jgi:hypothetical protein
MYTDYVRKPSRFGNLWVTYRKSVILILLDNNGLDLLASHLKDFETQESNDEQESDGDDTDENAEGEDEDDEDDEDGDGDKDSSRNNMLCLAHHQRDASAKDHVKV